MGADQYKITMNTTLPIDSTAISVVVTRDAKDGYHVRVNAPGYPTVETALTTLLPSDAAAFAPLLDKAIAASLALAGGVKQ